MPSSPAAPAGSAGAACAGSARPWPGSPRASRGSRRGRSRSSGSARLRSPSSSGRRPSPRTRTCWRCRSRRRPPARRWWTRRRSASPTASSPAPRPASSQSRAVRALVSVSSVVNVLLATMNSVSSGSRSAVASRMSVPSMLDTNRKRIERSLYWTQRLRRHRRPEVAAADADVDDIADGLAGGARPVAAADPERERGHPVENLVHVRATSWPSTRSGRPPAGGGRCGGPPGPR